MPSNYTYMDKRVKQYLVSKTVRNEIELVQMLADDYTPKEISLKLKQSARTVEGKIQVLRKTFECKSVRGLIVLFFREGLIK